MSAVWINVSFLVKLSRPRLWLYTFGAALFGVTVGILEHPSFPLLIVGSFLVLATVPVNLFLYGINDYFDSDTDATNPKKETFEVRVQKTEQRSLYAALVSGLLLVVFQMTQPLLVQVLCVIWYALVFSYNVPPLRYKARPIADLVIAGAYPLLGVIGYVMVTTQLPSVTILVPVIGLAVAFHVYSAIHDMPHDVRAGVITTAVWCGTPTKALFLSAASSLVTVGYFVHIGWYAVALVLSGYPLFFIYHWLSGVYTRDALRAYRMFIMLQYILGGIAGSMIVSVLASGVV